VGWRDRLRRRGWAVGPLRAGRTATGSRVTARVAGHDVWFESPDAELCPAPEAFATAFFLPALEEGAELRVRAPLDRTWLANTRALPPIFSEWWQLPERYPLWRRVAAHAERREPGPGVGLCFTAGIDSFFSLLRGDLGVSHLVFAHGYDIALADVDRMVHFERSFREVARVSRARPIVVRTNLREHRVFKRVSWERTHGAALAALGHLLSDTIGELVISPSWRYPDASVWGSTARTDPLWSGHRLTVTHGDATLGRYQKVPKVAHEPLLWDHLRVCWENRNPTGNCSRCEKCLRTMVALAACGQLSNYSVFDTRKPLAELVRELRSVPPHLHNSWRRLKDSDLEPDLVRAIKALLL